MNFQSQHIDENVAALEFQDITHTYSGVVPAVREVSLSVAPGEIVCLLGPSGCGKSTTLRIAAGIEKPQSGRVLIDGGLVSGEGAFVPPEGRKVGLVFQDFALFPHLTVDENVKFGLKHLPPQERSRQSIKALQLVGVDHLAAKFPNELSGGEQQRVALARALAPRPHIMLLDEPFSGLDRRLRDSVRDETLNILKQKDTASLLVTHDPEEAMRMADRVALMRDGRLVQVDTPVGIYKNPVDLHTAAFFSDINVLHTRVSSGRVETIFGEVSATDHKDGQPVTVAFRPQGIMLNGNGGPTNARVVRVRLIGEKALVEAEVPGLDSKIIQIYTLPHHMPEAGTDISLRFAPDATFMFDGHQSLD